MQPRQSESESKSQNQSQNNKSVSVEFSGLLYRSEPDAHEEQEAHVRRAWFVARAAHALLTQTNSEGEGTEGKKGKGGSIDDDALTDLEQLSRVWLCKETMGCVYNEELNTMIDNIKARSPDVWGRRRLPLPLD